MTSDLTPTRSPEYEDFEIRLSRARRGQYAVEVLRSPVGECKARSRLPPDQQQLGDQVAELRLPFTEKSQLVEVGQALFQFLFPPNVAQCWAASLAHAQAAERGLHFRLRIDAGELTQLPWELLYDPNRARFLIPSVETPLSRYLAVPEPIPPLGIKLPLRILLAVSSPPEYPQLDTEREVKWIREALAPLSKSVSLDILSPTTRQSLQTGLRRDYHVLHYIGHGQVAPQSGMGRLVLTDEVTQRACLQDSETLSYLLQDSSLRLVFLNACQTAVTRGVDAFLGVAQAMVGVGLPAVVAMQFDISDRSAATLARAFYGSLADGYRIQAAVSEARKAVLALTGSDAKDWATPALFMRSPSGILFEVKDGKGRQSGIAEDGESVKSGGPNGHTDGQQKSQSPHEEQPVEPSHANAELSAATLRERLANRLNLDEIQTICFDLDVDYDNLRGQTKSAKVRELVDYFRRRERLPELIARIRNFRPDIPL